MTEQQALSVAADALREWQRDHGGESDYAPTTMFIDRAEQPAQAVLAALRRAGLALVPVAELWAHADGNTGEGCWDLHDKYEALTAPVVKP